MSKVEIISFGVINIEWAINDSFWVNDTARGEAVEVLKAVHASGLQTDLVNLVGTFSMIDQFGNKSEDPVVWLTYSLATVQQINWADELFVDYSLQKNIYEIADSSKVHQALTE